MLLWRAVNGVHAEDGSGNGGCALLWDQFQHVVPVGGCCLLQPAVSPRSSPRIPLPLCCCSILLLQTPSRVHVEPVVSFCM